MCVLMGSWVLLFLAKLLGGTSVTHLCDGTTPESVGIKGNRGGK